PRPGVHRPRHRRRAGPVQSGRAPLRRGDHTAEALVPDGRPRSQPGRSEDVQGAGGFPPEVRPATGGSLMSAAPSGRRSILLSLLTLRGNPRGKSWWYAALRLGVGGLYLYAALVVLLVALEDRLLYRPVAAAAHWNPPPRGLEPRDVEFTDADGMRLHG